jgi:signal transduction histidine kinase
MLSRLRLRLTLLFMLAALLLVGLNSGGKYLFVRWYLQSATDWALEHRLVQELERRGQPVPADLLAADHAWRAARPRLFAGVVDVEVEASYDGDLAAIFILPLTADGQPLDAPGPDAPPVAPDRSALAAALQQGRDWRTETLSSGARVRLLTYRLNSDGGPAVLQVGRVLADQDRVLTQMVLALLGLGSLSAGLVGAGSWWLAGRSLRPAEEAWARQQSFVANASHDLRTPLTVMRASADLLRRSLSDDDAERRALVGDLLYECDHMSRLVNDLLLLSRLDAGRLRLERAVIPLPGLLADVQRQFGYLADERGVTIALDRPRGAIWGDQRRLRQVLFILLDNALRHTPAGGTIRLAAEPCGARVALSVTDTGCGIAAEHLPHLFERFYRVDDARGEEDGGSGLGLAIAKALVEAQGGRIALTSRLGAGTRVTVTLPAAPAPEQSAEPTSPDTAVPAQGR